METERPVAKLLMRVKAYPRIHVGLADMGFASQRAFGGVGFSIDYSPTVMDFAFSDVFVLSGREQLDHSARRDLDCILKRLQGVAGVQPFHARIMSHAPQHCGFGSKTSLALTLVAGTNHLCRMSLSRHEMQILSGRGAASGVGIHAFFEGGVICDGGHKVHRSRELLPSSAKVLTDVPPLLSRIEFPMQWSVILLLGNAPSLSGDWEVAFFRKHAPIDQNDALKTIANLYHGILASFAASDYPTLTSALAELHSRGFKMSELMRCDEPTRHCLEAIRRQGLAVGISSVGPLIYVIIEREDASAFSRVFEAADVHGINVLGVTHGCNSGYQIIGSEP